MQAQLARFQTGEVEELVDQLLQPRRVAVHEVQVFLQRRRQRPVRPRQRRLDRPPDERQRRAELVAEVGKKARLHLVEFHQFLCLGLDLRLLFDDLRRALGHELAQLQRPALQLPRPALHEAVDQPERQ